MDTTATSTTGTTAQSSNAYNGNMNNDHRSILVAIQSLFNRKPIDIQALQSQSPHCQEYPYRLHHGSCHCKQIEFLVYLNQYDYNNNAAKCNCTICIKKGILHMIVPPRQFQLTHGSIVDDMSLYSYGTHQAKHLFCKLCGIHCFYMAKSHPYDIDININSIDNDDDGYSELMRSCKFKEFDGENYDASLEKLKQEQREQG